MTEKQIKQILEPLEKISRRRGSLGSVFRDWVQLSMLALCRDDESYLEIINRYDQSGEKGSRDADYFADAFGELLIASNRENHDVLGEVYLYISSNYSKKGLGQFFTPITICDFMAAVIIGEDLPEAPSVCDPCCGSGRLLISAAKRLPSDAVFIATDVDRVCAHITAVNLCLFNMNGTILHGNSLSWEYWQGWITKYSPLGGRIRELTTEELESYVERNGEALENAARQKQETETMPEDPGSQLTLF